MFRRPPSSACGVELQHLENAEFVCADLAKPDVPDLIAKRFDVVYGLDVFEYVPNPEVCLQNLARILQPGGMMLLSYPNVPPPRGDGVTWFEQKQDARRAAQRCWIRPLRDR